LSTLIGRYNDPSIIGNEESCDVRNWIENERVALSALEKHATIKSFLATDPNGEIHNINEQTLSQPFTGEFSKKENGRIRDVFDSISDAESFALSFNPLNDRTITFFMRKSPSGHAMVGTIYDTGIRISGLGTIHLSTNDRNALYATIQDTRGKPEIDEQSSDPDELRQWLDELTEWAKLHPSSERIKTIYDEKSVESIVNLLQGLPRCSDNFYDTDWRAGEHYLWDLNKTLRQTAPVETSLGHNARALMTRLLESA
jgi:hypothetical protein